MVMVRAIYQDGNLQLLDRVQLENGQEVQLHIVEKTITTRDLIGDLLNPFNLELDEINEQAIQKDLDEAMVGKRPLSEIIIEERHTTQPLSQSTNLCPVHLLHHCVYLRHPFEQVLAEKSHRR